MLDELKTLQRDPSLVLRSRTPDRVLQEIYGYLCVHYALRSLIGEVTRDLDEVPLRISCTRPLRAARQFTGRAPGFSPKRHAAAFVVFRR